MGKHKEKSKKHKHEKSKKQKKHKKRRQSSSDESASTEDEWVEKQPHSTVEDVSSLREERNEWLSLPENFLTTSNLDRRKEREIEKRLKKEQDAYKPYKPGESTRELNPYWKDGGDGLPSFKKPNYDNESSAKPRNEYKMQNRSSNWRKKTPATDTKEIIYTNMVEQKEEVNECISNNDDDESAPKILSHKELNTLAAKLVKAEIMGNTKQIAELKAKLSEAREMRAKHPDQTPNEEVILTRMDSKGYVKPVQVQADYGEGTSKRKKQKVETHSQGERIRYFADDDKYSLKQMFENERFNSVEEQNSEFLKMAGKIRKNDDMDEIFADNIRKKVSDADIDRKNKDKAIGEHHRMAQSLDNCSRCLQSNNMLKHLMISMSNTVYLSLPAHEPLTDGHCVLIPIRHAPCTTQIDENEWAEIMDFRKQLVKMFKSRDEDVIFFETANYLSRHPHMMIECIPLPKEVGDMAPIYFKKAIDESETEWASNKKLVSLAGRNVMKAIPKGLPYFTVSFGLEEGYAHVIEDEELFPKNFAQEIIGGMMDLHHSKWRKPRRESFDEQSKRVLEFTKVWKNFDCTK